MPIDNLEDKETSMQRAVSPSDLPLAITEGLAEAEEHDQRVKELADSLSSLLGIKTANALTVHCRWHCSEIYREERQATLAALEQLALLANSTCR